MYLYAREQTFFPFRNENFVAHHFFLHAKKITSLSEKTQRVSC